jgi:hypothetical protein
MRSLASRKTGGERRPWWVCEHGSRVATTAMRTGKSGEMARLGARGLVLLLGMTACDGRCGGSSVGAESSPPVAEAVAAEEVAPEAAKPIKEVRITLADVEDIPQDELRLFESPKYALRELGKPKVLLEGKYLRLSEAYRSIAPDRGFVMVQDGPNYESKVLEARLLDLRTGKVLTSLRALYRGASYNALGVALGKADVDGGLHEVLVHASDGRIVPLWPVEQAQERFVVINAGTGNAWVFEAQKLEDGAEGDPYPPYRYAYWGDLRKQPPEPKEAFALRLDEDNSPPGGWLGPTWQDPADAPLFLKADSDDDECAKVELRPGGYKCVPFGTWAMAEGWRGKVKEDRPPEMTNAEKGERQVLELGEDCTIDEVTLEPPRAVLRCEGSYDRFLWSPERVVRVAAELSFAGGHWSDRRHVVEHSRYSEPDHLPIQTIWIDMVGLRATESPGVRSVSLVSDNGQLMISNWLPDDVESYHANVLTRQAHSIPIDGRECADIVTEASDFPLNVSVCVEHDDSPKRMVLVDTEKHVIWKLPLLERVWVRHSDRTLIGLRRERGRTLVLRWTID